MAAQENFFKTQIRMPEELYEQVKDSAEHNFRSFNAEIIYWLSVCMGNKQAPATPEELRQLIREELTKAGK